MNDKELDEIIDMFCVIDPRPYPNGTGVWGADTEIFSTDEDKTGLEKAREEVNKIVKKAEEKKVAELKKRGLKREVKEPTIKNRIKALTERKYVLTDDDFDEVLGK